MEFSRRLLSTLTTGHSTDSGGTAADATTFTEESLDALRLNISNPGLSTAVMKDNMLRLIYGEMMGQDVQFGVIYALKLAQSGQTVAEKRADLVLPYLDQIKDSLYDPEPSVMSAALGFFAVAVKNHAREMKELVSALIKILQQVVDGKLPKGYLYHGMAAPWIQIRCLMIMAQLGHDDLSASTAMTPVVLRAFQKASQGVDAAFDTTRNPLLTIPRFATSSNPNLKYLGISMLCQVNPDAWSDAWWTEDLLGAVVQALESRDVAIQKRALDLLYRMLTVENAKNIIERLVFAFFQEQDDLHSLGGVSSQQGGQDRRKGERLPSQQLSSFSMRLFPSRSEKILEQILDAADRFGPSEEWYLNLIFDLLVRGGSAITLQTAEKVMGVVEQGKSPGFDNSRLPILAAQHSMRFLVQQDYSLSTVSLDRRQPPALAYFVFWALGEYGDRIDAVEEEGYELPVVLEALARCLLANQADTLIQSFILSTLIKLGVRMLPNPIPVSITTAVRQQCFLNSSTATLSTAIEVQQRAAEFLMIADLAVS
ncbi:AP-4 complex subunit epsilon-1 [Linnemannia zychae]|nr:AP-4 complex subunit epsilon-1 [Linnemannia zychae]